MNCWSEVKEGTEICPGCGSDIRAMSGEPFKEKLIRALNHPEPETIIRAVKILSVLGETESATRLISLLKKTQDPYIIKAVAEALITFSPEFKKEILSVLKGNIPVTVKELLL